MNKAKTALIPESFSSYNVMWESFILSLPFFVAAASHHVAEHSLCLKLGVTTFDMSELDYDVCTSF